MDEIVANFFITKNSTKCSFLNFLLKNPKQVIDIYADIKLPLATTMASIRPLNRLQALLTMSLSIVHGEYVHDKGHQAGLDAIGMSLKFA